MKNRLVIRCDDYPYGDPRHLSMYKDLISKYNSCYPVGTAPTTN